jgi:hypothetical protein
MGKIGSGQRALTLRRTGTPNSRRRVRCTAREEEARLADELGLWRRFRRERCWCSLPQWKSAQNCVSFALPRISARARLRNGRVCFAPTRLASNTATPSLRLEHLKSTLMRWKFRCIGFFTDEVPAKMPKLPRLKDDSSSWGVRGKERSAFQKLAKALSQMDDRDRKLLLSMAQGFARRSGKR